MQQVGSLTADVEPVRNASSGAEGLQASVAALEQQLASKESEVAELQQQSQTHASSAERLGGELASLQGQLDEMEDMNTRLEAAAAETASTFAFGASLPPSCCIVLCLPCHHDLFPGGPWWRKA